MKGLNRSDPGLMPLPRALRRLLALALPPLLVVMVSLTPLQPTELTRLLPGLLQSAQAWSLPRWGGQNPSTTADGPLEPSEPSGRLQEVSPPEAVQQLQSALADRLPQVQIESPRDGALLPEGTWQLKLKVRDWPLTDAGELGLGAHLVVQLDDLPPQRLTGAAQVPSGQRDRATSLSLVADEPALGPGSHRLTVYAARPWGEAVKSPGALQQITVNRLLANPLSLPQAGSPQLLPVSPAELSANEPVLLDWILLDAPLQNLRDGDGSWRLRVTINGDRFLMDQNVPLWLRGWKPGRNTLQLELLDGLGQPLNPPFNSLVQEVDLNPPGSNAAARPRWLQGRLSADELAQILGDRPAEQPAVVPAREPDDDDPRKPQPQNADHPNPAATQTTGLGQPAEARATGGVAGTSAAPAEVDGPEETTTLEPDAGLNPPSTQDEPSRDSLELGADGRETEEEQQQNQEPEAPAEPAPEAPAEADDENPQPSDPLPGAAPGRALLPDATRSAQADQSVEANGNAPEPNQQNDLASPELIEAPLQEPLELDAQPEASTPDASLGEASPAQETLEPSRLDETKLDASGTGEQPLAEEHRDEEPLVDHSLADDTQGQPPAVGDQLSVEPEPSAASPDVRRPEDQATPGLSPAPPALDLAPPQRISSSTPLGAPARQQVNARGELIQPPSQGPLAGLRQLLRGS